MTDPARGRQLVCCGLGGQGIVFLARLVAEAAVRDGHAVLTAETHGMSQRGGAVEAHLKLGDFASSLVRPGSADAVLALDASRVEAARALLRPGGACFADTPRAEAGVAGVDASGLARELGFAKGRNLVVLGFAQAARPDLLPSGEALLAALHALSPPGAREANGRAFRRGGELA